MTDAERGAEMYNSKLRENAIGAIFEEYPSVPQSEVRRIYRYLENFCKLINGGTIPNNVFRTAMPCSAFQIRNEVLNFIEKNLDTYKNMSTKEIILNVFGEDKYNEALKKYSSKEKLEEDVALPHVGVGEIKGTMEDVDGGTRTKRKRKRKGKTKRRSSKRKSKRQKSRKHI